MKRNTRLAILLTCVLGLLAQVGCVTKAPATRDATADFSADVADGTRAYILFGRDGTQAERADRVHRTAAALKEATQRDVNISDLRRLAIDIAVRDEQRQEVAQFLVDVLISRVKRQLGLAIDVTIVPAEQLGQTRELLVAAADAALLASEQYKPR
jgi:hypothetical protein